MAVYHFHRGKFGMYNTPAWAGQTRALKFVRLLIQQGYCGIKYIEGPLKDYDIHDLVKSLRSKYIDIFMYRDTRELDRIIKKGLNSQSPLYYEVRFEEKQ